MKLSDKCPYEFPCLMKGKQRTHFQGKVFVVSINEYLDDIEGNRVVNAICVKSNKENEVGENYQLNSDDVIEVLKPYYGQILLHSEQLNPNLI